ncbi:MAG: hypothetical protein HY430_03205 [Candidatus Levybacteria bacterium]|nr:hypothetical protein [Candidatus Levybacteria bacterium]
MGLEIRSGGEFSTIPRQPAPVDRERFLHQVQVEMGIRESLMSGPQTSAIVTPERHDELFHDIAFIGELLVNSGVPFFLGGGAGVALAGEEDLHRDQYDLDFKAYAHHATLLIPFLNNAGFRTLDPETRRWLFTGNKIPKKIMAFKTNPELTVGPGRFDIYLMENSDETIREYRNLPIPEAVYTNGTRHVDINGVTIPVAPLQVTLLYKLCSIAAAEPPRGADRDDFARYFPTLSDEQFAEFCVLYSSIKDKFLLDLEAEKSQTFDA